MKTAQSKKGFTLIELLVVIGILAVLLAITLIAINPAKQFAQANDTKRRSDVNAILNAVDQYAADNKGNLPAGIGNCTVTDPCVIAKTGTGTVDLCATLVTKYLAALPTDPQAGTDGTTSGAPVSTCTAAYDTAYSIYQASGGDNRITVTATHSEVSTDPISVTR